MPKPAARPFLVGGPVKLKYEVKFALLNTGRLQPDRTIIADVNDTGDETTNKADALLDAIFKLDDEGIKDWSLKSCVMVTS